MREFVKRILNGGLRLLSLIFLIGMSISSYTDLISPDTFVLPAFMGIAFPLFFFPSVCITAYWAWRRSKFFFVCLGFIILSWGSIHKYCPLNLFNDLDRGKKHLKVMTYNTCGMGVYGKEDTSDEILDFVAAENADVVCFQEFRDTDSSRKLTLKKIRSKLSAYKYFSYSPSQFSKKTGLAIFSKYPIVSKRNIFFNDSRYNHACLFEVRLENGMCVNVLNCHLRSNQLSSEDRALYKGAIDGMDLDKIKQLKGGVFSKLAQAFRNRSNQVDTINALTSRLKDPLIICGDFNDTPTSYCYRQMKGDLQDAFVNKGMGLGITYHSNYFWFRIDQIFHSDDFSTAKVKVHKVKYSDHYPLTATLNINI